MNVKWKISLDMYECPHIGFLRYPFDYRGKRNNDPFCKLEGQSRCRVEECPLKFKEEE